jgi:hypothetical protein
MYVIILIKSETGIASIKIKYDLLLNVVLVYLVVVDSKIYGTSLIFLNDTTSPLGFPELVMFDVNVISSSVILFKLSYGLL